MLHEKLNIRVEESREKSCLWTYILDDSKEFCVHDRPLVLVLPGGGSSRISGNYVRGI